MWNEYWIEDKVSHGRYGSETPYLTIKKQLHLNKMKLLLQVKLFYWLLCQHLYSMHKLSKIEAFWSIN